MADVKFFEKLTYDPHKFTNHFFKGRLRRPATTAGYEKTAPENASCSSTNFGKEWEGKKLLIQSFTSSTASGMAKTVEERARQDSNLRPADFQS